MPWLLPGSCWLSATGVRGDWAELGELPYTHTAKAGGLRLPLLSGNVPQNMQHLITAHALFPAVTACLPHWHSCPFPWQGIVIESNPLKHGGQTAL